jgi:transketolase
MTTTTAPKPAGVTGNILASATDGAEKTEVAPFGHALVKLGEANPRVLGMTADLGKYTDMHIFAQRFPERFFQIGMAEQNLVGVACGLARTGFVPFLTTYCVFATRRAYDFIAIGAALVKTNIKIIAGLPGLTTGYGGTHQGIEDLALMRSIPNLTVIDPCDATEISQATAAIGAYDGPVYMRLLRGAVPVTLDPTSYRFEIGKARLLAKGSDVAIVSTGLMTGRALAAAKALEAEGIRAAVLHVSTIKPFDHGAVLETIAHCGGKVVTAENHVITGGLGSAVADAVVDEGMAVRMKRIGIPDCFCESGSLPFLVRKYNMHADDIADACRRLVNV